MVATTSAGLFGNLGANHGKLNTRKGKSFLWGNANRRMQGHNLKIQEQPASKSKLKKLRAQIKAEAALVTQKQVLILINSALVAALALMAIV